MVFGQKVFVVCITMAMLLAVGCSSTDGSTGSSTTPVDNMHNTDGSAVVPVPLASSDARLLVVTGENFKFVVGGKDNPDIFVKYGDKVRIEFTSTSGFHDWVVDELNARTERVRPGTPTAVEFIADKKGTFEYYCSVESHRAEGMKGKLVVG